MYAFYAIWMIPELIVDLRRCRSFSWKRPTTLAKVLYVVDNLSAHSCRLRSTLMKSVNVASTALALQEAITWYPSNRLAKTLLDRIADTLWAIIYMLVVIGWFVPSSPRMRTHPNPRISILLHGKALHLPKSVRIYRLIVFIYLCVVILPYLAMGLATVFVDNTTKDDLNLAITAVQIGYFLIAYLGCTVFLVRICVWLARPQSKQGSSKVQHPHFAAPLPALQVIRLIRKKHLWISIVNVGVIFTIAAAVQSIIANDATAMDRFGTLLNFQSHFSQVAHVCLVKSVLFSVGDLVTFFGYFMFLENYSLRYGCSPKGLLAGWRNDSTSTISFKSKSTNSKSTNSSPERASGNTNSATQSIHNGSSPESESSASST